VACDGSSVQGMQARAPDKQMASPVDRRYLDPDLIKLLDALLHLLQGAINFCLQFPGSTPHVCELYVYQLRIINKNMCF
jgi:hypothetical protein